MVVEIYFYFHLCSACLCFFVGLFSQSNIQLRFHFFIETTIEKYSSKKGKYKNRTYGSMRTPMVQVASRCCDCCCCRRRIFDLTLIIIDDIYIVDISTNTNTHITFVVLDLKLQDGTAEFCVSFRFDLHLLFYFIIFFFRMCVPEQNICENVTEIIVSSFCLFSF